MLIQFIERKVSLIVRRYANTIHWRKRTILHQVTLTCYCVFRSKRSSSHFAMEFRVGSDARVSNAWVVFTLISPIYEEDSPVEIILNCQRISQFQKKYKSSSMLLQSRFILVCLHLIDLLTFVYGNRPYVSVRGFFQGLTMIDSGRLSTYRASLCSGCVCHVPVTAILYCVRRNIICAASA